jgi:hypothetical protein
MRSPELVDGSDIKAHLPRLAQLAAEAETVLEIGLHGGESTRALLSGGANVTSLDVVDCSAAAAAIQNARLQYVKTDSRAWEGEGEFDGLLIDSEHTYACLLEELLRYGPRTRKWIVMHDTYVFGETDMYGKGPGLLRAIEDFMEERPEWYVAEVYTNNNGLVVLRKSPQEIDNFLEG